MKLYVSDLDGTLLDKNAEISEYTLSTLNKLIDRGMSFTVATARTNATVSKILSGLSLNVPVILMNGVLILDTEKQNYIFKAVIEKESITKIVNAIHNHKLYAFMYSVDDTDMTAYYEKIATDAMQDFYQERKYKYYKSFEQVNNLSDIKSDIVYFSLLNTEQALRPLYDELSQIPEIKCVFYEDVYSDDLWYLEVFSSKASKKNAVDFLRNQYSYDEIICFGDNLNDIPLFKASDKRYAVENAHPQLKAIADGIIGSNTDNGVAEFLCNNYGKDF